MGLKNKCTRCDGSGVFYGPNGKPLGNCFYCKGAGSIDASGKQNQIANAGRSEPKPWAGRKLEIIDSPLIEMMNTAWEHDSINKRGAHLTIGEYKFAWKYSHKEGKAVTRVYIDRIDGVKCGYIHIVLPDISKVEWRIDYATSEQDQHNIQQLLIKPDIEDSIRASGRAAFRCPLCKGGFSNTLQAEGGLHPHCAEVLGLNT